MGRDSEKTRVAVTNDEPRSAYSTSLIPLESSALSFFLSSLFFLSSMAARDEQQKRDRSKRGIFLRLPMKSTRNEHACVCVFANCAPRASVTLWLYTCEKEKNFKSSGCNFLGEVREKFFMGE